jgi:hypothetical protein
MPSKIENKSFRKLSFAVAAGFNVDRAGGILRNLALISGDREAKGHGLYVDPETIKTAHECALARGQLKGAMRHLSWDDYFSQGGDRVLDFPGWFSGFSVKGADLVAEKFEFYETFRTDPETLPAFNRIMEIAEKTPNLIGLSIEAWGYAVFVAEDGKEYGTKPDGVPLKYDGVPALRITDLFFAAFVDEPAATDGLFAKFSALFGAKQKLSLTAAAELDAALSTWADKHAPAAMAKPGEGPVPALSETKEFSSTMKIIAELKAKITDAKRFAAAMSIVGNTPADKLASLTVGEVEQQLFATDLSVAQGEVTRLTTELSAEQKKVTDLTTERDEWKNKFETLKKSGKLAPVDLGADTGGAAAAEEPNPWLKASFNRTKQAELTKKDPERAKALKAAALSANAAAKK